MYLVLGAYTPKVLVTPSGLRVVTGIVFDGYCYFSLATKQRLMYEHEYTCGILLDLCSAYYIKYNDYSEPLENKKLMRQRFVRKQRVFFLDSYIVIGFNFKTQRGAGV